MLPRLLADLVVVVHLTFLVFVAVGALLALRWRWVLWLHVPSLVWAGAIVTIGFTCPLTPLEKALRRMAGERGYDGGFIDHYVEGVVYPESLTPLLRAIVAAAVVAGYATLYRRHKHAVEFLGRTSIDGCRRVPESENELAEARRLAERSIKETARPVQPSTADGSGTVVA